MSGQLHAPPTLAPVKETSRYPLFEHRKIYSPYGNRVTVRWPSSQREISGSMKITNSVNNASSSWLITRVCLPTATVTHQGGNARGHKRATQHAEIFDLSTISVCVATL